MVNLIKRARTSNKRARIITFFQSPSLSSDGATATAEQLEGRDCWETVAACNDAVLAHSFGTSCT